MCFYFFGLICPLTSFFGFKPGGETFNQIRLGMTVSPIHTWTKLKGKSQVKLPVGFLLYLLVILPSQILQNLTEKIQQRICLMFVRVSSVLYLRFPG